MTIGRIAIVIFIAAILGYVGMHIEGLVSAPELTLSSPAEDLTTSINSIIIKGKTDPGANIEINGNQIPPPTSGNFEHLIVLNKGLNVITIIARKRYSRPATVERQIYILDANEQISSQQVIGTNI